jgi:hypothetical protein
MHKNYKRVLMYAHAVMVFIVVLEINEAPFPHIFSFVGYPNHKLLLALMLSSIKKKRRSPIFEYCK